MLACGKPEKAVSALVKLGAWAAKDAFRKVRKRIDPSEYGGAPLLGVKGCCVIGHGKSTAYAIKHGVRVSAEFFRGGVNARVESELRQGAARRAAARVS